MRSSRKGSGGYGKYSQLCYARPLYRHGYLDAVINVVLKVFAREESDSTTTTKTSYNGNGNVKFALRWSIVTLERSFQIFNEP